LSGAALANGVGEGAIAANVQRTIVTKTDAILCIIAPSSPHAIVC
jgi:hypothetical protein